MRQDEAEMAAGTEHPGGLLRVAGIGASLAGLLVSVAGGALVLSLEPAVMAAGLAVLAGGIYLIRLGQRLVPGAKERHAAAAPSVPPAGPSAAPRQPGLPLEQHLQMVFHRFFLVASLAIAGGFLAIFWSVGEAVHLQVAVASFSFAIYSWRSAVRAVRAESRYPPPPCDSAFAE